jgi:hypothetical protein
VRTGLGHPHFSLQIFGDVRESIEKRACARDSRSSADPENAVSPAISRNRPFFLSARFAKVRGLSPLIRLG